MPFAPTCPIFPANDSIKGESCLFAHIDPFCDTALITQHVAAPVETAVAALGACLPQDVVSTATAQWVTCIHFWTTLVADAALSARRVHGRITLTEVRRFLKVNQFPGEAAPPKPAMLRSSSSCCYTWVKHTTVLVLGVDEDGSLELLSQQGAHQPELRRHIPAGLELAASWGAMTFALPFHVVCHYLFQQKVISASVLGNRVLKAGYFLKDSTYHVLVILVTNIKTK